MKEDNFLKTIYIIINNVLLKMTLLSPNPRIKFYI